MTATVKESTQQIIAELSDDVTWDEIQYRLYLQEMIDEAEAEVVAGKVVSHEEVEESLAKWLK
jgi:predicted transcriptional regulator